MKHFKLYVVVWKESYQTIKYTWNSLQYYYTVVYCRMN